MKDLNQQLTDHYHKTGLFEDIVQRLKEQHIPLDRVKRSDIAGVDEFHVRGAEVSKELASSIALKGLHVLDVGCGLGGPCRMLAEEYQCHTTGIDLSPEYVRTAQKLSELVRLNDRTTFVQGDAIQLPFKDGSFDVVWTQHVQMNIPDKIRFYQEIARVLKPGGHFLFYDILKKGTEPVTYPMPWANRVEHSFLFRFDAMDDILTQLGLVKQTSKDQTLEGIAFFEGLLEKIEVYGPPKLGLNVLMEASTLPKLTNLYNHLKAEKLELISGVYRK